MAAVAWPHFGAAPGRRFRLAWHGSPHCQVTSLINVKKYQLVTKISVDSIIGIMYIIGMETENELMDRPIQLLVTASMLAAIDAAWHGARLPSRNDWIRAAIEAALAAPPGGKE